MATVISGSPSLTPYATALYYYNCVTPYCSLTPAFPPMKDSTRDTSMPGANFTSALSTRYMRMNFHNSWSHYFLVSFLFRNVRELKARFHNLIFYFCKFIFSFFVHGYCKILIYFYSLISDIYEKHTQWKVLVNEWIVSHIYVEKMSSNLIIFLKIICKIYLSRQSVLINDGEIVMSCFLE